MWMGLLFSLVLTVMVFFAGPVYIVMVGEDVGFVEELRLMLEFTWRRAASSLGITVLLFLVGNWAEPDPLDRIIPVVRHGRAGEQAIGNIYT